MKFVLLTLLMVPTAALAEPRASFMCTNANSVLNIAIGFDGNGDPCGLKTLGDQIYGFDCASEGLRQADAEDGQLAISYFFDQGKDLRLYFRIHLPKDFASRDRFSATYNMLVNQEPPDLEGPVRNPAIVDCVKVIAKP